MTFRESLINQRRRGLHGNRHPRGPLAVCLFVRRTIPCGCAKTTASIMKPGTGSNGNIQGISQGPARSWWFTFVDWALEFSQLSVTQPDCHTKAFRNAFGHLWENEACGSGLTILLRALASMVAGVLEDSNGDAGETYLDDSWIYSADFNRHTTLIDTVHTRMHGRSCQ